MNARIAIATALIAVVAGAQTAAAQDARSEKCYGVSKAGKNDCQTATSSCAGTAKKDAQADAWISVPAGICAKLTSGSTTPKS